jgi:hypothetical protein
LVESDWQKSGFHLIYRDNLEHAIMVASVLNIDHPQWTLQRLIDWPVDGWEPSIDPQQWLRLKQVHLLLQHVGQVDGNDSATFSMAPQRLELLIWPPL